MAFPQGIDFRNTSGFVVDPTNCTFEIGLAANYPETTPQGNNVGWSAPAGFSAPSNVDRNSGVDPRLAGIAYTTASSKILYRIDLPSAGSYNLNVAIGDINQGQGPFSFRVYDGTDDTGTLLQTIVNNASTGGPGQFFDATSTLQTSAANWITANPQGGGGAGAITLTFATTHAAFVGTGEAGTFVMAHIWMQATTTTAIVWLYTA